VASVNFSAVIEELCGKPRQQLKLWDRPVGPLSFARVIAYRRRPRKKEMKSLAGMDA